MRVDALHLQDFRNCALAHLHFRGSSHFICAPNGQGKTNLLEAIGMVTALRSFRTHEQSALIRHGQSSARLLFAVEHEQLGKTEIEFEFSKGRKQLRQDGESVKRYRDYIGQFPVVACSSQDIMLLRGSPAQRRRFLDMMLAAYSSDYLEALQNYNQGMKERNHVLKHGREVALFNAIEAAMAGHAVTLRQMRQDALSALHLTLQETYKAISPVAEAPSLQYQPNTEATTAEDFAAVWEKQRKRDCLLQTTTKGPHRDDFLLSLQEQPAREYASEGQQRGLVLALRLAQMRWYQTQTRIQPVLLADDVLGELDPMRRSRFWQAVDPAVQVFASGTTLLETAQRDWQVFTVESGEFRPQS